jgi:FMN reductase
VTESVGGALIGVVVGNPRPASRTLAVAESVATAAAAAAGLAAPARVTLDLAGFGPELFDWSSERVRGAVEAVRGCALAVVASPTYKASYSGLLKSFLDWFSTTDLAGVTVVPVMVGAAPHHALAVEVHLRPVLVELGASLLTRGLYVMEDQLAELDAVVAAFMEEAGPRLRAALAGRS